LKIGIRLSAIARPRWVIFTRTSPISDAFNATRIPCRLWPVLVR